MSEILRLKDKKEKINIFRTLFKGRDNVFAKYWVSHKTGKEGYSPACKNEWIPQLCRKPCEKCENKDYIPLGDSWIEKHLMGKIIIGFKILKKADISRDNKNKGGFDRIFPNQDFLRNGGLGNLIALPLQYHARQKGNTLFLNIENGYKPYQDQWDLLKNIKKIGEIDIERFLKGPSSNILLTEKPLKITISNYLSIPVEDTNREFYQFLRKNLVIHNPIFYEKKAKGFSTWNTQK